LPTLLLRTHRGDGLGDGGLLDEIVLRIGGSVASRTLLLGTLDGCVVGDEDLLELLPRGLRGRWGPAWHGREEWRLVRVSIVAFGFLGELLATPISDVSLYADLTRVTARVRGAYLVAALKALRTPRRNHYELLFDRQTTAFAPLGLFDAHGAALVSILVDAKVRNVADSCSAPEASGWRHVVIGSLRWRSCGNWCGRWLVWSGWSYALLVYEG
jgi:hypothetical protein